MSHIDASSKMLGEIHKLTEKMVIVAEQMKIFSSQLQEIRHNLVLLENAHLNLAKEVKK